MDEILLWSKRRKIRNSCECPEHFRVTNGSELYAMAQNMCFSLQNWLKIISSLRIWNGMLEWQPDTFTNASLNINTHQLETISGNIMIVSWEWKAANFTCLRSAAAKLSCLRNAVHQGPVPERCNNSIPRINVPYSRNIPGIPLSPG